MTDLTTVEPWASYPPSHTDIKRLRQGKVGAQVMFHFFGTIHLDRYLLCYFCPFW